MIGALPEMVYPTFVAYGWAAGRGKEGCLPILWSESDLRSPSNRERSQPRPCGESLQRQALAREHLMGQGCDGIREKQEIDQRPGVIEERQTPFSMAKSQDAPGSTRCRTRNAGECDEYRGRDSPFPDPHRVPGQIKEECPKRDAADNAMDQARLIWHDGHIHSSSLQPSITKGSQQIGKQQTSRTANNTQPPVDSFRFEKTGGPWYPQKGQATPVGPLAGAP